MHEVGVEVGERQNVPLLGPLNPALEDDATVAGVPSVTGGLLLRSYEGGGYRVEGGLGGRTRGRGRVRERVGARLGESPGGPKSGVGWSLTVPMVVALELGMRDVLFANWPLEPDVVAAHLPDSLSVDTYDGRAWLTVVVLENVDVRPRGLPSALGIALPEINVHTNVTRDGVPGIYYFSVEVAGLLGTLFPRLFYHAPYHYADIEMRSADGRTRVDCQRRHPGSRPVHFDALYWPSGGELDVESEPRARFLADRHRFFTETLDSTLCSATIRHAPWPLFPADATIGRNTLFRAAGFGDPPDDPVCYYSPGVDAEMSRCRPWRSRAKA